MRPVVDGSVFERRHTATRRGFGLKPEITSIEREASEKALSFLLVVETLASGSSGNQIVKTFLSSAQIA